MRAADAERYGSSETGCLGLGLGSRKCRCNYCLEIRARVAGRFPDSIGGMVQWAVTANA